MTLPVSLSAQPAEECPCFEDAVAFLSVVAGAALGEAWSPAVFPTHSYGYAWRSAAEVGLWSGAVGVKLVTGACSSPNRHGRAAEEVRAPS